MNDSINNFEPNQFPTYWSEKKGTTFIIRMSADKGVTVIGNNKFFNKTHFGNRTLLEERLRFFKEISVEEFNISK